MIRRLCCTFLLVCIGLGMSARIALPDILSDYMVLQQHTQVKFWGTATPGSAVSVSPGWSTQATAYTTESDGEGRWMILIPTPEASYQTHRITISDETSSVTLNHILIGEVWFCSGQSNMEMPLNGFFNCPISGANHTIATAGNHPAIRFATIPKTAALTPQESCAGKWVENNPANAQWFSATAYHFATLLQSVLNVPVGIIHCSWGGSTVEGWLPEKILAQYPDVDLSQAGSKEGTEWLQPMIMYNGMLKPLQNYTVRGFLWYQGESNVGRHDTYAERLATMVSLWREEWELGELPFYFVEIAPYEYGPGDWGAYLREAQFRAQTLIPNSGMISTNDLVESFESYNIHPRNKTEIGRRLAYMALSETYDVQGIRSGGPSYRSMDIQGDSILLHFDRAEEGFSRMQEITGFEIAGEDRIFYPAGAEVNWNREIIVSSPQVSKPVAVRYGFHNYLPGNIADHRGLPLYPFRTDNW